MKKIITTILVLTMLLSFAGCSAQNTDTETTAANEENQIADTSVNEGELQAGVYTGTASYSEGEFSMTWNMVVTFNEDNTFVLNNETGEEKGAGTYELTDSCYTMAYDDDRTCTFVVQEDGSLKMTAALPYGKSSISLEEVGGIVLNYHGDSYEFAASEADTTTGATTDAAADTAADAGDVSVTAGTYSASYTKESQMAGTVVYNYTAELGEDGSFSYAVTFDMKGTMYDGSSASGTYAVEDGKFVFTDTEGSVIDGAVTGENTFVISLKASEMASDPYEVTFVPAE